MNIERYNWDDINKYSKELVVYARSKKIDTIIGIARGGLPPAVIISNHLNCPMFTIGIKSYDDQERLCIETTQDLDYGLLDGNSILVVDDICDSGKSLKYIKSNLDKNCKVKDVHTAALFLRDKSIFEPNIYSKKIIDDRWIIFPWEPK
tara:strand:- start:310 stop:756 length:447 start_codon:yes stop_codon:yes gene_type:complete